MTDMDPLGLVFQYPIRVDEIENFVRIGSHPEAPDVSVPYSGR